MVLAAGSLFSVTAIVNELALGNRPAIASRFGPTDPELEPPDCWRFPEGRVRPHALELHMDASVDDRRTGQVVIEGIRNGANVHWSGFAATALMVGQLGVTRIWPDAWQRMPGTGWYPTGLGRVTGSDLDRQLVLEALTPDNRSVAEDRGLAFIEGARARHCRVTIDGDTLGLRCRRSRS